MSDRSIGQGQEISDDFVMQDWPDRQDGDVTWVYVSLIGDDFVEAVSLVPTNTADGVRVRELEWGRP